MEWRRNKDNVDFDAYSWRPMRNEFFVFLRPTNWGAAVLAFRLGGERLFNDVKAWQIGRKVDTDKRTVAMEKRRFIVVCSKS
mmetsp:Transcript_17782/g.21318  ORF Transcript_17782/g.21318 Transcript_17782/m.21318 type:complete len:82 (+) Transcript_17782:647-892(+)